MPRRFIPLFQILMSSAIYYNNERLNNYTIKLLSKKTKDWRHIIHKTEIKEIHKGIFIDFRDRKQFFDRIEENCKRPKIAKLNVGEFVNIEEFKPPKSLWEKLKSLLNELN